MNERIKELSKEAEIYALTLVGREVNYVEVFDQKFAELIVQECADIAKHHVMNISTYADADFVDEQIREHFGVEE